MREPSTRTAQRDGCVGLPKTLVSKRYRESAKMLKKVRLVKNASSRMLSRVTSRTTSLLSSTIHARYPVLDGQSRSSSILSTSSGSTGEPRIAPDDVFII